MRVNKITVGLIICGDTGMEWQALRAVLESFGLKVIIYPIGRPNDFIDILNGAALYAGINHLIICAHGENGAFLLPELSQEIFEKGEPRVTQFDASLIERYGKLKGQLVLTTGCTLGDGMLAEAFIKIGCRRFIGPEGYIEGNAAIFFVVRFYYEMIANGRQEEEAFQIAKSTDSETDLFWSVILGQS